MVYSFFIPLLILWKPWTAYLVLGLVLIAALWLIRRYELNRIRLKNQLMLEKIETDTLRSIDRLKSKFFANISHEFRTPLTLILGQVESLILAGQNSLDKQKLHGIDTNARQLLLLINQILDLSKLDAGNMELSVSRHNIVPFLKGLLFSFESQAARKGITLAFESEPDNILLAFDPDKMEKIFFNLISNALKHTGEGGNVVIRMHIVNNHFVEILVGMNNHGIAADQLPHLFDRFHQVDGSGSSFREGTGLGMALARELVELHQGTITVELEDTGKTIFTVRFLLDESTLAGSTKPAHKVGQFSIASSTGDGYDDAEDVDHNNAYDQAGGRDLVLIVEDNQNVRELIREHLSNDYTVMEAENGLAGLAIAQETLPDLIISDLMMPVMDGCRLCKEIRNDSRTSHIPVIMLTARAGIEDKIEGLESGADDYLSKPFSSLELKVRVRNLIHQRRMLRDRYSTATYIKPSEVTAIPVDKLFLEKIINSIEANLEDSDFSVESLSSELRMSVSQLNRKLNALIGQPAGQLIRSMRLQRAAELLEKDAGTVAQISYQFGFSDQAYFSRAFRKQFGCSPGEYKKERKVQ